ncbi:MAG: pirin family protein [Thiobacillaceae bacterium]|jgi:redox-sensitive bicupin YhaK (pirin superfamily)
MIQVRKAEIRGHANFGWLDSWHTFSFGQYHEPARMGVGALRVINDDTVAPGKGFPRHGHEDMEIVTYVLEGAREHQDSLGNKGKIRAGEVQRMRAGTGIEHSEYNASDIAPVHFLQIWICPDQRGLEPGYEQSSVAPNLMAGRFHLIASSRPRPDAVHIHQDAAIYAAILKAGESSDLPIPADRRAYLQLASGEAVIGNYPLRQGDGAALVDERNLHLDTATGAEVLVFVLT